MILEEVLCHPNRIDLFIDIIVTPHENVLENDRSEIKKILLQTLKN